jgi:electron transfer flavoprotein alpha subunit
MEKILYLAHTNPEGALPKTSLEGMTAAMQMKDQLAGSQLTVAVVGKDSDQAATALGGCGAEKFLVVTGEDFDQARYATDAAAVEALCKNSEATIVLAPASSRWSRVMGGVAQRLGGCIDTHITSFEGSDGSLTAHRWYYRQRMKAVQKRTARPWILTIDPGCFSPFQPNGAEAEIEKVEASLSDPDRRTTVMRIQEPEVSEQTIRPEAELLFVAGAGWTKKQPDGQAHVEQAEELILGLLHRAKASLGSSKSLVDLGSEGQAVLPFMTHLNQVGQTGSTPRHPKGLATCCHGEEPHAVGWRFINERRAINTDPNCGWAQGKADVLYVADAFEVIRKLNEMLGS